MRRIIPLTLLALTLFGGVALADRDHRDQRERREVREHRDVRRGGVTVQPNFRYDYRHDRRYARPTPVRHHVNRGPIYVNNGYYQFHNGARYRYTRPVIRHRYFDIRVRPRIIVENYTPVAGYVWVAGNWQWNGGEWIWISGHYAVDPAYVGVY